MVCLQRLAGCPKGLTGGPPLDAKIPLMYSNFLSHGFYFVNLMYTYLDIVINSLTTIHMVLAYIIREKSLTL